ncbi:hypothetical protein LCGC14_2477050, partial [marine sediment metagenome]
MNDSKIFRDTLFIDMKYIILYRKLGYIEINPDIFSFDYRDITIIIESENQLFIFKNNSYQLKEYKDFVLLECIDRLLRKGYNATNILIYYDNFHLSVIKDNQILFNVLVSGWDDYENLISTYSHRSENIIALYSSQLSGGLVDFISTIYKHDHVYNSGIFEKNTNLNDFNLTHEKSSIIYPEEFEDNNDILKKYRKPQSTKTIDNAIYVLKSMGINIIPNIIIGLPGETLHTYVETYKWILNNRHKFLMLNITNFVPYAGTEAAIGMTKEISDENQTVTPRSYHTKEETFTTSVFTHLLFELGME